MIVSTKIVSKAIQANSLLPKFGQSEIETVFFQFLFQTNFEIIKTCGGN